MPQCLSKLMMKIAFNLLGSAFVSKTNSNRNVSVFGTSVDVNINLIFMMLV